MKRKIKNIAWISLGIMPILFWLEIYKAWTTEYDKNWGHFFIAIIVSFITVGLFMFLRSDNIIKPTIKWFVQIFSFLFSTPLTVFLIIIYISTIPMQFIWSRSYAYNGMSYKYEKRRNYFKAENLITIDNLETNVDTIKAIIKRNGKIESLLRIQSGQEIKLNINELDFLNKEQITELTKY